MDINNDVKNMRDGMDVISNIIKVAGDNPNTKEAANNLGKTAVILTQTMNNALLPLAAINFSFDKAREYFSEKFEEDIIEKMNNISQENIIEPKASIAGPVLQGLAFSHEEQTLKDMYLSLLSTAMDDTTADDAHPAFVEIIKQLTSEEAELLEFVLNNNGGLPICEVRLQEQDKSSWNILLKHLINIANLETGEASENSRFPSMIENWIRLGLVEVSYTTWLSDSDIYEWKNTRPEVEKFRKQYDNEKFTITFQNGIISRTALGKRFAKAVDILKKSNNTLEYE